MRPSSDPHTERFVVVYRAYDPVQAEMMCGVLGDAGLNARLIGTRSAASIGAGPSIADLKVEVPASHEARATEILASILDTDGRALLRDAGMLVDEPGELPRALVAPRARRWGAIALGVGLAAAVVAVVVGVLA
jgi:hypothetical protein